MGRFYRKVDRFVYKLLPFEMYHPFSSAHEPFVLSYTD